MFVKENLKKLHKLRFGERRLTDSNYRGHIIRTNSVINLRQYKNVFLITTIKEIRYPYGVDTNLKYT